MSKILFSFISGIADQNEIPCFYDGFIKALSRSGNDVLVIVNNRIISNCWLTNRSVNNLDKKALSRKIVDFAPDLVIAWNNSLYEEVPKIVDCPIVIYGIDSPAVFSDLKVLGPNISRYNMILASEQFCAMVKDYFGTSYRSLDVVRFATDFRAQDLEQNKNVSFIGTNFSFAATKFKKIFYRNFSEKKRRDFALFYREFLKNLHKKPSDHLRDLGLDEDLLADISHIDMLNLVSSNDRVQVLQAVSDLGLSLYGTKDWYDVCEYSLPLALSFTEKKVSSMQDNQDIYNSSKVSINISHAQAGDAFSWRVRDIMACNSALVSDPRKDLETEFGEYVKIPTYENAFEARKICEKLLKDDIWRKEIIAGSQLAIEENHRFEHRMKDISQITGVDLFGENKGCVEVLNPDDFFNTSRFKSFVYSKFKLKNVAVDKNKASKSVIKRLNRRRINLCRTLKGKVLCSKCYNWINEE